MASTTTTTRTGALHTDAWTEATWDGAAADGVAGPKQTVATVTSRWEGALEADSEQRWLMTYDTDGSARYVGMERLTGTLDGRAGGCVLTHRGSFSAEGLHSAFEVVEGSGTGDWSGIRGSGELTNPDHGPRTTWRADLELAG